MNAKVKRYSMIDSADPKIIYPREHDGGLWIECEVTGPPSSSGRTVYLHVEDDLITPMLLEFRDAARRQRELTADA